MGPYPSAPSVLLSSLIKEFYINIEQMDKYNGSYIDTSVRGRRIEISRDGLAFWDFSL